MKKNNVEDMIKPEEDAVEVKASKQKKVKEPKVTKAGSDVKIIIGIVLK